MLKNIKNSKFILFATLSITASVSSGLSLAADMPVRGFATADSIDQWSGIYVGASASGSAFSAVMTPTVMASFAGVAYSGTPEMQKSLDFTSAGFGVSIGSKRQYGNVVYGFEADIQRNSGTSSAQFTCAAPVSGTVCEPVSGNPFTSIQASHKINYSTTSVVSLGFAVSPGILVYGAAGVAVANINTSVTPTFNGAGPVTYTATANTNNFRAAPAIGVGTSLALHKNITADILVLHENYGNLSSGAASYGGTGGGSAWTQTTSTSSQITNNKVRFSLQYKIQ